MFDFKFDHVNSIFRRRAKNIDKAKQERLRKEFHESRRVCQSLTNRQQPTLKSYDDWLTLNGKTYEVQQDYTSKAIPNNSYLYTPKENKRIHARLRSALDYSWMKNKEHKWYDSAMMEVVQQHYSETKSNHVQSFDEETFVLPYLKVRKSVISPLSTRASPSPRMRRHKKGLSPVLIPKKSKLSLHSSVSPWKVEPIE